MHELSKRLYEEYNCELTVSYISRLEKGQRANPGYYFARQIMAILDISQKEADIVFGLKINEACCTVEEIIRTTPIKANGAEIACAYFFSKFKFQIKIKGENSYGRIIKLLW